MNAVEHFLSEAEPLLEQTNDLYDAEKPEASVVVKDSNILEVGRLKSC